MGSGTGVLAIIAVKYGERVDAIDIDEWADENCREYRANNVEQQITPALGMPRYLWVATTILYSQCQPQYPTCRYGALCWLTQRGWRPTIKWLLRGGYRTTSGVRYYTRAHNGWLRRAWLGPDAS